MSGVFVIGSSQLDNDDRARKVSTRKSCEGHADGRLGRVATPGVGVFVRGSVGLRWWRLCPGAEVFGVGVPGQEAFEAGA